MDIDWKQLGATAKKIVVALGAGTTLMIGCLSLSGPLQSLLASRHVESSHADAKTRDSGIWQSYHDQIAKQIAEVDKTVDHAEKAKFDGLVNEAIRLAKDNPFDAKHSLCPILDAEPNVDLDDSVNDIYSHYTIKYSGLVKSVEDGVAMPDACSNVIMLTAKGKMVLGDYAPDLASGRYGMGGAVDVSKIDLKAVNEQLAASLADLQNEPLSDVAASAPIKGCRVQSDAPVLRRWNPITGTTDDHAIALKYKFTGKPADGLASHYDLICRHDADGRVVDKGMSYSLVITRVADDAPDYLKTLDGLTLSNGAVLAADDVLSKVNDETWDDSAIYGVAPVDSDAAGTDAQVIVQPDGTEKPTGNKTESEWKTELGPDDGEGNEKTSLELTRNGLDWSIA